MKKLIFSLCFALASTSAMAQKPNGLVIPFGPAGVSDTVGRIVVKALPANKYIAINKPGAQSQIAVEYSNKNNSMMLSTASSVFAANLFAVKNLSYNPDRDLEIIASVGISPVVLVCHRQTGLETINDVLTTKKPLSFGVGGIGTSEHLVTELLFSMMKSRPILATYVGGHPASVNLAGGHIDCIFGNYVTLRPLLKNSNLKVIISSHAVDTAIPTWTQTFKKSFPIESYLAINVSSKLDPQLKKEYSQDLTEALQKESVKQELGQAGLFVKAGTSSSDIKQVIDANMSIRKFIQTNNINLQELK